MLGAAKISQMLLMEPHSFEELSQAIQALGTEGRCFEYDYFDSEQAQQAIDFVAGATYAIDGHPQLISERVCLFVAVFMSVLNQALFTTISYNFFERFIYNKWVSGFYYLNCGSSEGIETDYPPPSLN